MIGDARWLGLGNKPETVSGQLNSCAINSLYDSQLIIVIATNLLIIVIFYYWHIFTNNNVRFFFVDTYSCIHLFLYLNYSMTKQNYTYYSVRKRNSSGKSSCSCSNHEPNSSSRFSSSFSSSPVCTP